MKKIKSCLFVSMIFAALVCFAGCKNDFEMEKPSEIAVSDLEYEVGKSLSSSTSATWEWDVVLTWYYDSADPADYLIICRDQDGDEIKKSRHSSTLKAFGYHTFTDTIYTAGKYTYTVYTVGNYSSTSASASVTVTCE